MDPKTTKKLLKDANDAIKAKNFDQANELTSRILMFDGRNYNALIFRGLCRENSNLGDEALTCYRSAVEIKPEAPLGWQALVSFFEKQQNEADNDSLLEAYRKLLQLSDASNPKRSDWMLNSLRLLIKSQQHNEALTLAEKDLGNVSSEEHRFQIQLCLVDLYKRLGSPEKLMAIEEDLILNSSQHFVDDPQRLSDIIRSYIQSLRKSNCDIELLRSKCSDALIIQPDHVLALETIFLLQFEEVLLSPFLEEAALAILKRRGNDLPPEHPLCALLHGLDTWVLGNPEAALTALEQDAETLKVARWRVSALLRTRLAAAIHRVDVCREAHTKPPGPHQSESIHALERISRAIQFSYWHCCVTAGDVEQVAHICKQELPAIRTELMQEGPQWRILIASMLILIGKLDEAQSILDAMTLPENVYVQEALRLCQGSLSFHQKNYQEVLSILEAHDTKSEELILKGKALWALDRFEEANSKFVDAIEKDRFSWEAFLFIGKFNEQEKKFGDARAAYRHSFELNRNSQNGEAWCDFLFKRRQYKDALKILERVTLERTNLKWAWFRKGNIHWAMKNPSDAVYAYQNAMNCDRTDPIVHECLGDCNSALSSNETAVKNYKEALKIDPQREYSQIRIPVLLHKLGQYQSAVEEYNKALEMASESNKIQVFKGLGDTYLALATEALQKRLVKLAVAHTEKAIYFLTKAFALRPQFVSVIRPLADAFLLLHVVSDLELQLSIPVVLLSGSFTEGFSEEKKTVDKERMLQLATRLYGTALQLKNDCVDTWCCLGYALVQLALVTSDLKLMNEAENCVRHALTLQSEETSAWNLLGVIYSMQRQTLFQAQHCFIQAIRIDSKNAVAWSNLGFFYLVNEHIKLAHDVFNRSQTEDMVWVFPWLGQGRIARAAGHQYEAMDLFRHSLVLGHTEFGALSYARLVLHFLHNADEHKSLLFRRNVVQPNAIVTASEALEHSLEMDPHNRLVLHCQALLLDRLNNHHKAEALIQKCLTSSSGDDVGLHLNALRILEFGKRPEERLPLPKMKLNSVRRLCVFGYLEAARGHLEKAIEYYEQAIELSNSSLEKAVIAAAVGFHAFESDPDSELTSEWLFRSGDEDERSPDSILGFAAFSILTDDEEIASCLLSDLNEMDNDPHAAYLLSLLLRMTQSDMEGQRSLLKAIYKQPSDARLWHYLGRYFLTSRDEENEAGPLSAHAAQVALALRPTLASHAHLLGEVYRRFGDCLGRRLERRICGLFRLFPTDAVARANVATVARRQSDHAERGAVRVLRNFASAMRQFEN